MKRTVQKLAYVHVYSEDPAQTADFFRELFGWEVAEGQKGQLNVAMDRYAHRISIYKREQSGIKAVGWQALNRKDFMETANILANAGVPYVMGTEEECQERGVTAFLSFTDPAGVTAEVCYAPHVTRPGIQSVGRLDVLDLVHVTIMLPPDKYEPALEFYQDVLGFEISDISTIGPGAVAFTRCSENHHNLAFGAMPVPEPSLNHIMFEVGKIEDVMKTYYKAIDKRIKIKGPGRHGNCRTQHVYLQIPGLGETDLEIGYGHLKIPEDGKWEVVNYKFDDFEGFTAGIINAWL
ncbi:VOC family protein [Kyrpidia sp.]|uniref:VOC family protein n=1 Tax=Kyrpidia sp. TaxID=2073077 RepID=UPI002583CC8B|nr:VOC family protein [Kyrpidia sp.]MCL6577255.1 VOC family protein [Kyrpidia sp.]